MSVNPQPSYRLVHGIKVNRFDPQSETDMVASVPSDSVTYNYYDDAKYGSSDEPHDLEIPRYQLA